MSEAEFKFNVGQELTVISKDRNLNGKKVKIVSRHSRTLSEDKNDTRSHISPWYKVGGDWIQGYLSFFEEQLI